MPYYPPPATSASTVYQETNGLRLSLTTGVPVTSSDVTAASTLFFTPYLSTNIALFISSTWTIKSTSEISLALSSLTSGKNYDVFAFWTGSAVNIELLAWSTDSARATSLVFQDGVRVKSGATDRRYVGTIRTSGTTTTEDSQLQRFVWNGPEPARQIIRTMKRTEANGTSWVYSTTSTVRQANANTANKVECVIGLPSGLNANLLACALPPNGGGANVGIGINSTSAIDSNSSFTLLQGNGNFTGTIFPLTASYSNTVAEGYYAINWLEYTTVATTFYGSFAAQPQDGLTAQVLA